VRLGPHPLSLVIGQEKAHGAGRDHTLEVEIGDLLLQTRAGQPLPDRDHIARRVHAGLAPETGITVADYLRQWHRSRKMEATTLSGYAGHIRNHLIPHLGHLPVDELRVRHIQHMFDAITERNTTVELARNSDDPALRASVKGMRITSAATMHRIRATRRKALNDAIRRHRIIEFNPAAHIELPSGKRPKAKVWTTAAVTAWRTTGQRPSTVMVWTPAQAGAFLDYAETHDIVLYPLFALILHRGLRRGEAVGLRDADVDLDTGTITISQQITTLDGHPITKKVKSDAGDRTVRLGEVVTAELRAYRARRNRWQLVTGPGWSHTDLFFVQPTGIAYHPEIVSNRFEQFVADAGYHPSACTTCATAPRPSSRPPAPT
jgi:integrase